MPTIAEAFARATQSHQAGQLQAAEQLCQQVLQADPSHADTLHLLGIIACQTGRFEFALQCLVRAKDLQPRNAAFQANLAIVYQQSGRLAEAEVCYRQALALNPNSPEALSNLGFALKELGRLDEAVHCCREAIRLRPQFVAAFNNLGHTLHAQGRLDEAVASFREALRMQPNFVDAHTNLGNTLTAQGKRPEALACFRAAVRLVPSSADAHNQLGRALAEMGLREEALASFGEALRLQPNLAAAHNNQGNVLLALGRLDDAVASFRASLRLQPDSYMAYNNLGIALAGQTKREEAVASYREALRLQPTYASAHNNLGIELAALGRPDEAVASYREALRLQPNYTGAHNNLGIALAALARLDEAVACFRAALRLDPNYIDAHSNLLTCMNYLLDVEPEELFAEHRRWGAQHGQKSVPLPVHPNDRNPKRRLRVGYVSTDFREHPVTHFLEPILAHHDPARVDAVCYADFATPDAGTARLQKLARDWRWVFGQSEAKIAEQVQRDAIDILVDLGGHTAGSRLRLFTYKPAPVQVTYLGYPYSTGLTTIDYRLTDDVADPPDAAALYTEQLVRLPGCFCCYEPAASAPAVSELPADRAGRLTFGALHNMVKLNPTVLDCWSAILRALPEARLLIFRNTLTASLQETLRAQFAARGVQDDQLDLRTGQSSNRQHLSLYQEIDISLDSFPWSGHTTACEALWMGVPVVTLRGARHAGRMVASVLTCLQMTDWIAATLVEYVALAIARARDRDHLRALRSSLRETMRTSPLCDGRRFTRGLEDAYRNMWRNWLDRPR